MSVHAEPVRRPWFPGASLRDLSGRAARILTAAVDRPRQAVAIDGGYALPLASRLRIATFIALATGVLFLPVDEIKGFFGSAGMKIEECNEQGNGVSIIAVKS